ncbi:MAG: sulfatase-like hydrolase/transferase [Pirellulales bacterium]|nr:sulfatase-like hydrolase/transferase [Pirellulales bacterium]
MHIHRHVIVVVLALCGVSPAGPIEAADVRPNILWISCEDASPNLGCYGDADAVTPALDRLAGEGVRYTSVFSVAGVCAPTRSTIITGVYASTLGSMHMRCEAALPAEVKCFPEYLRDAGYYCTNNKKTDYNFKAPKSAWDACHGRAHWRNRPPGAPFFAVFNIEVTHESQIRASDAQHAANTKRLSAAQLQDPNRLAPPPFHPDTDVARRDWARYRELVTAMDYEVGDRLKELRDAGLEQNTIVFFWADHGAGLPRMKRWLHDSGTRVPMLVRVPEKYRASGQGAPGTVDDQLVSFVDLAPTVLHLAGVPIPAHMQGRAFLGHDLAPPREYVFAARDRMDERYDLIRAVRDHRYRYVRNYQPEKPYAQVLEYAEQMPTLRAMRRLLAQGQLNGPAALFFRDRKPVEELYDLTNDPHEIHNLADSPEHKDALARLRAVHERWMAETRDLGLIPEPELALLAKRHGSQYAILRQPGAARLIERLHAAADASCAGREADLVAALDDPEAAVRCWAVAGLGNVEGISPAALDRLGDALADGSATVRVAAARALWRRGQPDRAMGVLLRELASDQEWVRLAAAGTLDDMGPLAADARDALREAAQRDPNGYVVRVAKHALARLQSAR